MTETPEPNPTLAPFTPPYIPSSGDPYYSDNPPMSRSALDGVHGTRGDEPVRWSPSHEGELPPYWMNRYNQDQNDPDLWWPAPPPGPNEIRPPAPGDVQPSSFDGKGDEEKPGEQGAGAGHVRVNPADLNNAADQYIELQMAAAAIGPQAVDEVNRIIASHGAMGYPVAVGVVAGLARRQARVEGKAADFGVYATRLNEHAATYLDQDQAGARGYGETAQFTSMRSQSDPWDWDGESEEYEPINPGGAAAGPGAGPAIPPALI
ncbi:hypothetical protein BEL07_20535 [Mycolicibacterium grossiae]|uniref:Uncharacterized protein n=1 Tax=Mycolicibacterium grossiae TaxID=1552759 RepID=A0A1E8Q1I8_9MYCO|nr:hypothetical protein [Mycolicibacterium grossiae]OFJ51850.1 hypothetical protein BEL07_20535 [Mycolicibacterium grossiae]